MNRLLNFILSVSTGLLLMAAWPVNGWFPLLFIAWIPFLWLEKNISKQHNKGHIVFGYAYLSVFIWNVGTTWWVKNASEGGAAMAILANSLLMAMVLTLFHLFKRKTNEKVGYIAWIAFWMSFEFIHLNWDITWPWLNLGNGFAGHIKFIQWYEYTGAPGGTLWIMGANLLGFYLISGRKTLIPLLLWIAVPIIISLIIFHQFIPQGNKVNVVVVQPNIDPYNEKFNNLSGEEQLNRFLSEGAKLINDSTDFLVGPETAIVDGVLENELFEDLSVKAIQKFMKKYPRLHVLVGASTYYRYARGEKLSSTARYLDKIDLYYESYNTGMQFNPNGEVLIYHKSKLVPGVEKMPWPAFFKYFEDFAIDLGGISGSLGMQNEREAFYTSDRKHAMASIICYESVYGEFVGEYVKKGADLLAIITNDGWWGDTPGYKQHLAYGSLRAIEHRRDIARSANTGISCFINQKGEISQSTSWWTDAVIKQDILANKKITFYTRFGDYLSRIALIISCFLVIYLFIAPKIKDISKS